MKKTTLEIYALAVCFVSTMACAVCLVLMGHQLIQIIHPALAISTYEYRDHQSNDRFWKNCGRRLCEMNEEPLPRPSEQQITEARLAAFEVILQDEQRSGWQSLARTLVTLLVSLLLFALHWALAKRARRADGAL